uniref:Uncharacterized protein n=1 Tax=Salix viminalis TaxID=40686 RepID=A0A6N2N1S4_SALVM
MCVRAEALKKAVDRRVLNRAEQNPKNSIKTLPVLRWVTFGNGGNSDSLIFWYIFCTGSLQVQRLGVFKAIN